MSCRELERLFLSDGSDAAAAAHREACGECARLGADLDRLASSAADLRAPAWSPGLRRALLEVPRMTVSCEAADGLTAALLEGEIEDADARRLRSHLSRCAGCAEAAETLGAMRSLSAPAPAPWLTTKLGATRPPKKRSLWRSAFSGRMVVAYAYAAALLVMVMGLNPTAVVRKTGFASLGESTRSAVLVAQSSIGDRLGALQEKALRTLAVWRGHVGGYGRAAVSNVIAFVLRPEPKKSASPPHLGKESDAAAAPGEVQLAGDRAPALRRGVTSPRREPFPTRFRV